MPENLEEKEEPAAGLATIAQKELVDPIRDSAVGCRSFRGDRVFARGASVVQTRPGGPDD